MKIKKVLKKAILISAVCLSGCSTYQESFDCPVGEGVRCASLSTVNKKMDRGEIEINPEENPPQTSTTTFGSDFAMGLRG